MENDTCKPDDDCVSTDGTEMVLIPKAQLNELLTLQGLSEQDERDDWGEGEYQSKLVSDLEDPDQNKIKVWREFRGLTIIQVSNALSVSEARINLIEEYDWKTVHRIPIETLQQLSTVLSCQVDDFLHWPHDIMDAQLL